MATRDDISLTVLGPGRSDAPTGVSWEDGGLVGGAGCPDEELLRVQDNRGRFLPRENSFLHMRDRAKSMEGGVLRPSRQSIANQTLPHLDTSMAPHHHQHSFWSRFQPSEISNRIQVKLSKMRKRNSERRNTKWQKVEKFVRKIVESSVFKFVMFLVVVAHIIVFSLYQPEVMNDTRPTNILIYHIFIMFLLIYFLEAGLNIMAYGLFLTPKKSFLRNPPFILDIVVIIFGILYLSLRADIPVLAEIFSSLTTLKLIRVLTLSNSVKFMLKALAKSAQPLFYLSVLTFLFILFLALVGIELFQGRLHGGCFSNYTTPAGYQRSVLVSDFPCNMLANDNETGSNLIVGDHMCPHNSQCMLWKEGPHQGVVSFDDIFRGLIIVFQSITLEGWSGIFFLYESAVGYAYAWIYFFIVIVLGSVLFLNLLTGVLTIVFVDVSEREQEHGNSRRLKEEKRIKKDMDQYNEWLRRGAELQHPSDTQSIDRSFVQFGGFPHVNRDFDEFDEDDKELEEEEEEKFGQAHEDSKEMRGCIRESYYKSSKKLRVAIRSPIWFWSDMIAHIFNLSLLMSLHFPSDPEFDSTIYILNHIFTLLFVLELVLRLYGVGPIKFFTSTIDDTFRLISRIVEVLIGVCSILALVVVLIPAVPDQRMFGFTILINALWSTKLVQIMKISEKNWARMKEVLRTLGSLIKVILSLMVLIGMFLYLFTIAGIRLFGNRLSITSSVQPNFDDMLNSFYLVFQLLTTEDWHNVLYSSVSAFIVNFGRYGVIISLYFVVSILLGAFVLVNAFLALSVDKLSEIRDLEEDETKEKESEEKERKNREQQISDLRDPKMATRRSTIRRLLRFQASNPADRAKSMTRSRVRWWKQLSLPQIVKQPSIVEFKRSASTPHPSVSSDTAAPTGREELAVIAEEGEWAGEDEVAGSSPTWSGGKKRSRNPLSNMQHQHQAPSSYVNPVPTATSTRMARMEKRQRASPPPVTMEMEGEEEGSVFSYSGKGRQMSVVSSPLERGEEQEAESRPTRRSQSLPSGDVTPSSKPYMGIYSIPESTNMDAESTDLSISLGMTTPTPDSADSAYGRKKKLSRQHSIDEEEKTGNQNLSQRYVRESSLEPIRQPVGQVHREDVHKTSTKEKVREKVVNAFKWMKAYFGSIHFDPSKELQGIPPHSAFFMIDHENSFRKVCFKIVTSHTFSTISFAMIVLSSVVLMLEFPNGLNSDKDPELCTVQDIIIWVDIGLLAFFVFEMLLKMISLGVIVHRDSYLRGFFNLLDFMITILTLVPVIYFLINFENKQSSETICISYGYDTQAIPASVSILRALRVFRPLRAIRIGGLYLAVTGLLSSFKAMVSIFFLDGLIIMIFAVLGVHYFRGSFFFCTDPTIETENDCIGYYYNYEYTFGLNLSVPGLPCPIASPRHWERHGLNFDNILFACLTLYTMLTAEGWQNVMYNGINSRTPNNTRTPLASATENNRIAAFYFIIYMTVVTFILLQLLVGFVIVTFQEVGVKTFRETKLDRNQRNCLHFALTARPTKEHLPRFKVQQKLKDKGVPVINSFLFRALIVIMLILNTVILCCQVNEMNNLLDVVYYVNLVCTIFFFLEVAIKFIVLSPPIFFKDIWNIFAFGIALGSVLELIIQLSIRELPSTLRQTHIVSTLRVLRLLEFIPRVKRILWTVIRSLEIFPWVGYLLLLIIYIYAVFGMHIFGNVAPVSVDESEEEGIHEYNNFSNFFNALLLMMRVITGENWQDVMISCLNGAPCDNTTGIISSEDKTCGNDFSYIFFPSFYFISTIMILNLFVAIIMDNFEYIVWDRSQLGAYDLGVFVRQWAKHDPKGDGKLKPEKVLDLLRRIDPPVGWGKLCHRVTAYKKMMRLNIPIHKETEEVDGVKKEVKIVTFNATLFALVRTSLEIDCKGCADCSKVCNVLLRGKLATLFPNLAESKFDEVLAKESDETVAAEYAALLVQAEWRSFILRRRKIVEIFQGPERKLLQVHREIQDPGPDLIKSRPLSTFHHDLEILELPPHGNRKISESSKSSGSDGSRLGSRSPKGPTSPPMPILAQSGVEFLMGIEDERLLSHARPTTPRLHRDEDPLGMRESPIMPRLRRGNSHDNSEEGTRRSPASPRPQDPYGIRGSPTLPRSRDLYGVRGSPTSPRLQDPYGIRGSPTLPRPRDLYGIRGSPTLPRPRDLYGTRRSSTSPRPQDPYETRGSPTLPRPLDLRGSPTLPRLPRDNSEEEPYGTPTAPHFQDRYETRGSPTSPRPRDPWGSSPTSPRPQDPWGSPTMLHLYRDHSDEEPFGDDSSFTSARSNPSRSQESLIYTESTV